ncbi:PLP-dependent aminotransferase family protein [Propioniciclava soli]|uniref:aminotransferase-like domain-containing protein n=1 Tax=Propioniciclava soli TaxID=2775081 RepID=UPI001E3199F1|nr:PLP-dependent aminotransferase family protein [Propioniciclava soli]
MPRRSTRLDPYVDQYAERTSSMTVSAVRALFAVANRPEVVSLAGGMPNITDLPLGTIGDAFNDLVRSAGVQAMQYGSGQGELFMREKIVEVMAEEQIHANPDDVVVTCGSQQALDLVTRIFIDPGDVILCEAPSYVGALGTFNASQARIHHVAMDEHGLLPDALRTAVLALRAEGARVKFLYTIPNYNNPTGITQTLDRRRALLDVAHEVDLLVVEDNPYGLLTFDGDPVPALRAMDDQVIYLGSFSKTFAPGFRIGWVLAPHAVRERLVIAQEAAVLSPPVFSQFAIAAYLDRFDWRGQIVAFRDMYRERRDAMLRGLEDHMPAGTTWTRPTGGFFVWVTLPEGLDSQALLARAVNERVAYVPGSAFYADGFGGRNLRASYCFPTAERIYEGTRRLGRVIAAELEMRATFGLGAETPLHRPGLGPAPDLS